MPGGRPSGYNSEIASAICERLVAGETLRTICSDDAMPSAPTIFQWIAKHEEFAKQYARAKESQMEAMAEEILEIADDTSHDTISTMTGFKPDSEWIQRSKLRVDTRRWLMSKIAPKKYGDRVSQEISGPDGGAISVSIELDSSYTPKGDEVQ